MKLIKQSLEIKDQEPGILGIYKQIEWAGRHCYKSHDKITDDSAEIFVNKMIASNHLAMCEHGTVYLIIPINRWENIEHLNFEYGSNPYSAVNYSQVDLFNWAGEVYITTNLRVLIENNWMKDIKYLSEPTEYHEKRVTVKFVTDQGVLREFTRHRKFSFAVESTRYCNYSLNRFNNELTYILPNWIDDGINISFPEIEDNWGKVLPEYYYELTELGQKEIDRSPIHLFMYSLYACEKLYLSLLKEGWSPQQARNVLPLATKCDLIMTGYISDWIEFAKLRALGTTGKPHPQAEELGNKLIFEFLKRNIKLC